MAASLGRNERGREHAGKPLLGVVQVRLGRGAAVGLRRHRPELQPPAAAQAGEEHVPVVGVEEVERITRYAARKTGSW
jgi:hypothetical protein